MPRGPHHVGEVRPREEFGALLVGGDIRQLLQAEELRDQDDVLVLQSQFCLQEGAVQADTLLQNREVGRDSSGTVNRSRRSRLCLHKSRKVPENHLAQIS